MQCLCYLLLPWLPSWNSALQNIYMKDRSVFSRTYSIHNTRWSHMPLKILDDTASGNGLNSVIKPTRRLWRFSGNSRVNSHFCIRWQPLFYTPAVFALWNIMVIFYFAGFLACGRFIYWHVANLIEYAHGLFVLCCLYSHGIFALISQSCGNWNICVVFLHQWRFFACELWCCWISYFIVPMDVSVYFGYEQLDNLIPLQHIIAVKFINQPYYQLAKRQEPSEHCHAVSSTISIDREGAFIAHIHRGVITATDICSSTVM